MVESFSVSFLLDRIEITRAIIGRMIAERIIAINKTKIRIRISSISGEGYYTCRLPPRDVANSQVRKDLFSLNYSPRGGWYFRTALIRQVSSLLIVGYNFRLCKSFYYACCQCCFWLSWAGRRRHM